MKYVLLNELPIGGIVAVHDHCLSSRAPVGHATLTRFISARNYWYNFEKIRGRGESPHLGLYGSNIQVYLLEEIDLKVIKEVIASAARRAASHPLDQKKKRLTFHIQPLTVFIDFEHSYDVLDICLAFSMISGNVVTSDSYSL